MRITHGIAPNGSSRVLTLGNFDGLHLGHQAMVARLQSIAEARGLPACVLTFEPHPREFFAPAQAPTRLTSLREKAELLRGMGVDQMHVCRFDRTFASLGAEDFVRRVLVDTLGACHVLVGDDFRFGKGRSGDIALLRRMGVDHDFACESLPTVAPDGGRASSTRVREVLAAGDMQAAARLLGRPYSISGRVVGGDRIGRTLGFPTANLQLRHNRPPVSGIFVIEAHGIDGRAWPGVASLGVRPTVTDSGRPVLEAFVFDFHGDLYGRRLRLDFLHKLRDEEKYPDLDRLRSAIAADVEAARHFHRQRHG